jgi:hypothetical protein
MSQQHENADTPPAVEPTHYDGPTKREQRVWNFGTTTLIAALAAVFVIVILIYVVTR